MEDLIKELKEGIGCVDKLQLTIAKLEEKVKGSALFTNSLGEKFFEGDMVYWVMKESLRLCCFNINFIRGCCKEGVLTTEIMTKGSAEKWIKEHEEKEVELVKGEWYTAEWGRDTCVFRFKSERLSETKAEQIISVFSQCLPKEFECGSEFYVYKRDFKKANQEQINQGVKAEEEHGKFWNKEKGDFLKLEDVCYNFTNIRDLVDIDGVREIETFPRKMFYQSVGGVEDITLGLYDNQLSIYENLIYNGRVKVDKQTFITLLKNHK